MRDNELNCTACKEIKNIDEFFYNEKSYGRKRGYRSSLCRDCIKERNKFYKQRERERKTTPTLDNQEFVNIMMKNLGYDTNSEKPVHIQFQERYGL